MDAREEDEEDIFGTMAVSSFEEGVLSTAIEKVRMNLLLGASANFCTCLGFVHSSDRPMYEHVGVEVSVSGGFIVKYKTLYQSILALACSLPYGDVRIPKLLVQNGAEVNRAWLRPRYENSPLHSACSSGRVEVLEFLLGQHPRVDVLSNHGQTPLSSVCSKPTYNGKILMELLVKHGANVDFRVYNPCMKGYSSLLESHFICSRIHHSSMVDFMLSLGADPNFEGDKTTPLVSALRHRDVSVTRHLLAASADVDLKCQLGFPCEIAAALEDGEGCLAMSTFFLESCPRITIEALFQAGFRKSCEMNQLYGSKFSTASPLKQLCRKAIHLKIRTLFNKSDSRAKHCLLGLPLPLVQYLRFE